MSICRHPRVTFKGHLGAVNALLNQGLGPVIAKELDGIPVVLRFDHEVVRADKEIENFFGGIEQIAAVMLCRFEVVLRTSIAAPDGDPVVLQEDLLQFIGWKQVDVLDGEGPLPFESAGAMTGRHASCNQAVPRLNLTTIRLGIGVKERNAALRIGQEREATRLKDLPEYGRVGCHPLVAGRIEENIKPANAARFVSEWPDIS